MMNRNLVIMMAGLFSFLSGCKGQGRKAEEFFSIGKFKVGQIWKYDNREGEDSSTLTILKLEKYDVGDTIIHIRVDGLNIYNPQSTAGKTTEIGHLPYSEKALSKCVTKLVGQNNNLPDFSDGYNQWKEAWDSGKGGYWTADLKEAINGIDQGMRQHKK
ncbi:MAG TPA: hypothetical protein VF939_14325 [Puia sp.]